MNQMKLMENKKVIKSPSKKVPATMLIEEIKEDREDAESVDHLGDLPKSLSTDPSEEFSGMGEMDQELKSP